MSIEPWDQQAQLQVLVEAGFAEVDEQVTAMNRRLAEHAAGTIHLPWYRWTDAGRQACWLYSETSPMAWAREGMMEGQVRHCIFCGRCTEGLPVVYQWPEDAGLDPNQTICEPCGEAGNVLPTSRDPA